MRLFRVRPLMDVVRLRKAFLSHSILDFALPAVAIAVLTMATDQGCLFAEDRPPAATVKFTGDAAPLQIDKLAARIPGLNARQRMLTKKVGAKTVPAPGDGRYHVIHAEFRTTEAARKLQLDGVHVFSQFGSFADVFVDNNEEALARLTNHPDLFWADVSGIIEVPPIPPVSPLPERTRAPADQIALGGVEGLSGRGVIVAVIDTGINFHHPDFVTVGSDGLPVSRVLAYWDTFSDLGGRGIVGLPAPISYPNGAPVGTIYSRDDLTDEIRRKDKRIVDFDADGHGTCCASIAAGNGRGKPGAKHIGVAPEADIVAVRVGAGKNAGLAHTYLFGAICDWLDRVGGDRPVVVSCSYGGHYGGHDGNTIEERQINARFSAARSGRAVCIAAGNEGSNPLHAVLTSGSKNDDGGVLQWQAAGDAYLELWLATDNTHDLQVTRSDSGIELLEGYVHPVTHHACVKFAVPAGKNAIRILSNSGNRISIDAYLLGDAAFDAEMAQPSGTVGLPGTAANAITVASYNWNDEVEQQGREVSLTDPWTDPNRPMVIGSLSGYSSRGFTRINSVKPDIASPGQWYLAAATVGTDSEQTDASGLYRIFNGTSAATPYTAGVIALMFEKSPKLTAGEIKVLLRKYASIPDGATADQLPRPDWGYGKLDRSAVVRIIRSLH